MKALILYLLLIISFLSLAQQEVNAEQKSNAESFLTKEELLWINEHPIITVGGEKDWAPFDFVNENGHYDGMALDYLNEISLLTGLRFKVEVGNSWRELLVKAQQKQIDLLPSLSYSKIREKYLHFSEPYFNLSQYIFTLRSKNNIKNINDLIGKKVVVVEAYQLNHWLTDNYPEIELVKAPTLLGALRLLSANKAAAFIGHSPSTLYAIKRHFITNIIIGNAVLEHPLEYYFMGVRKDYPLLKSILNKALHKIAVETKDNIKNKWFMQSVSADNHASPVQSITLLQILPIKLIFITLFITFAVGFFAYKHFKKKKHISLGVPAFIIVTLFSFVMLVITFISINNAERLAKEKQAQALTTILDITYKSVRNLLISQRGIIDYSVDTSSHDHSHFSSTELDDHDHQKEFQQIYQAINKYLPDAESYFVIEADNSISASSLSMAVGFKITNQFVLDNVNEARQIGYSYLPPVKSQLKIFNDFYHLVPLYDHNNKIIRIFALGIDVLKSFSGILQLGREGGSGETYAINHELEMISQSRFELSLHQKGLLKESQSSFLNISFKDQSLPFSNPPFIHKGGLNLHAGVNTDGYLDYRGNRVFGAWRHDEKLNITLVTEIDESEAMAAFWHLRTSGYTIVFTLLGLTILLVVFIIWISNRAKKALYKKNEQLRQFNVSLEDQVATRTQALNDAKNEIELTHKHIDESIEYASLIQGALIPDSGLLHHYFSDSMTIWQPKDTVGGDIFLFSPLRNDDECIVMVIDCTGHGVAGAFVTMLVKAIERQIVSKIQHGNEVVSPANLLSVFNRSMKHLLKQDSLDAKSNAGFDGGILYYNKKENYVKFAGAEIPLFYIKDEELHYIKGSRHSIGYKKSDVDFQFTEHTIVVEKGMQFYLTTDGFVDQNGGNKSFPFGKRRFSALITQYQHETMANQKALFLSALNTYQADEERNDDLTLVAVKI